MSEREDILSSRGEIFQRFFNMSLDMLCVVGFDGFFKKVNRAMIKTLGWTEEELLTRPWMEFVHPEDRQLTEAVQEKLADKRKSYFRNRYQGRNGSYHWFSWKAILVPEQNLIFAVARDITKQKRMEEALHRYRSDLGHQVQERTAVLTAINRIFRQALFCLNEEQLGRICLAAAKKLTGSKIGFIYEADQEGSFHTIAINVPGWFACELPPAATSPLREKWKICGIPGQIIESGKTLICNDPASHPDWLELSKGQLVITSFLGVPLKHVGQTVGMIGLANREGGYDKHHQEDVEALAVAVVEALMRKRAEVKLAQLRQYHQLILSSASEGILGLDLDGNVTFVNPAAAATLGYEVEELLDRNAHTVWHHTKPDGSPYPPAECPNLETLAGGVHIRIEDDLYWRKDGTNFPVRCSRNPIIQNGQVSGAVITFRDITERKRAEQALRESEEKYRLLVNQVPAVVFRGYDDWSIDFFDEKAEELTGYSKSDFDSRKVKWCDLIPVEDLNYAQKVFIDALKTDKSYVREHRIRRKDGEIRWVQCHGQIYCNAAGKVTHISGVTFDVTKRKQIEEKLRRSEETYRRIVETALEGIWTIDAENRVTFANNRFMEMLGYSLDEVMGEPIAKFMDREWLGKASTLITEHLLKGNKEHLDFKLRHKDGRELWVIMTASPMFDGEGRYAGSLGMVTDITARKQAERSLAEQFHFLQLLIDTIPSPVFYKDASGRYLGCNRAFEEFWAKPREEVIGQNVYEMGPKEIVEKYAEMDQELFERPGSQMYEWKVKAADGLEKEVIFHKASFLDADGKVAGLIGVILDITERKRAEEALRESEQRFRDISENAVEWIWEVDPEGKYTYSSPVVEKLLGYKPEEVLGKHFYDFFVPEEREELKDAALATFEAKQPFLNFINRNLRKDGESIWLSTSGIPVLDASGNLLGYRGADIDITARKQAERSLRESEEKYRLLVNQIPAVVFKGYADWSIDFFDNKIEAITGYSKKDFDSLKLKWQELILPEDLEEAKHKFIKALKTDRSYIREYRIRRKDGEIRWVQNLGQIFCDAGGKINHVSGVMFDITARKLAEEALQQSEEKFRRTFDQSPIGAALVGLDFRYQRVNAELCHITGYSEEELLARTFVDITHPGDVTSSMEMVRQLATGEIDNFTMIKRYLRKDGKTVWGRLSVRLIKDAAEKPLYYLPMIEDITAHKQADEKLQQSLSRLRQVMGDIVQAMALTVEIRDPYTAGHQRRVTRLAQAIALEMGLSQEQQEAVWCAGTLHDLGKVYVPEGILSRPGDLSDLEQALIHTHCQKGYEILKPIHFPWPVAQIVRQHHERLDGSGYPDGLQGEEIMLEARILAVADVVEAMASHRPYREALGIDAALEEIFRNRGTHFDPEVVDACLKVFKEQGFKFS